MRNALRVFARDLGRIIAAPKTWAIVLGLIIMPSLYAWVNIIAFWDPYSNTQDVKVAVVNLDRGATSEMTGPLNVGDQVVAQLEDNHDIGWQFLDEDEAMNAVESGSSYAAIVIPADFSENLLSVTTGDFVRPEVDYYVNEKANAIAPKITDVAASTVDTQINGTFVSTVAKTLTEQLRSAGVDTGDRLSTAQSDALGALEEAAAKIQDARAGVADVQTSLSDAQVALGDATAALQEVDGTIGEVQTAIAEAQTIVSEVQSSLVGFTDAVTNAYLSSASLLADASAKVNAMIAQVTVGAQQASVVIGSAVDDAAAVVDANGVALAQLQELLDGMDPADPGYAALSDAIVQLQERNGADQQLLTDLQGLDGDVDQMIAAILASADAINATVSGGTSAASSLGAALRSTLPDINQSMSTMAASAAAFSSAVGAQQVLVGQALDLLGGLNTQLGDTVTALTALDGSLSGAEDDLDQLRTDVVALGAAEVWAQVQALTGLEPSQIAEFMASPVTVKEHALFPVKTYGSAMAPLFTNLSLWIGAFMLVVLLRQEVDTDGVEDLTVRQAYLGRFTLLAMFATMQALLVSIGNIVIGVQMVNPFVFVATSVFAGLVYLSIIYALAVSFGYIGKGLTILLVVMQIPGASGIYPIQMMPGFFQALFPFFPFTYSIDAMRETIGGFYDGYYWRAVGVLLLFAVLAFILGLFLRHRLGNFARLVNRNLGKTGLFVAEDVQILGSRRRLTQIVEALSDRSRFRRKTARQAAWLNAHHLTVIRLAVLIGVALTVLLAGIGMLVPEVKSTVLALWGLTCLLVIAIVILVEYLRQSVAFARQVGRTPDHELREELRQEEAATHSTTPLEEIEQHDRAEESAGVGTSRSSGKEDQVAPA
jgi:putative membrane protein